MRILILNPDFLSNCCFYGCVIDLLTKRVFKQSALIWVTQAWPVCVPSSSAGGDNESRRKIVFKHLRMWQGFSGWSTDRLRQWRSASLLWSGLSSHLTSVDTALREGTPNVRLLLWLSSSGARKYWAHLVKLSVSAAEEAEEASSRDTFYPSTFEPAHACKCSFRKCHSVHLQHLWNGCMSHLQVLVCT